MASIERMFGLLGKHGMDSMVVCFSFTKMIK
jgi:hypothetical protein